MSETPLENLTFEMALAELEKIIRELEDGQIGLEESLAHYEKGVGLLKRCYGQLQQAEQKILILKGVDGDDRPVTEPFETAETKQETPENKRRRKKSNDGENLF
jgi:exodeoxyribonuclease VII small subunit